MTSYRRNRVEGGSCFFKGASGRAAIAIAERPCRTLARGLSIRNQRRPLTIDAIAFLPDHLRAIWTLPAGDDDLAGRSRLIKTHCPAPCRGGARTPPRLRLCRRRRPAPERDEREYGERQDLRAYRRDRRAADIASAFSRAGDRLIAAIHRRLRRRRRAGSATARVRRTRRAPPRPRPRSRQAPSGSSRGRRGAAPPPSSPAPGRR
jgi:hypothetical protein